MKKNLVILILPFVVPLFLVSCKSGSDRSESTSNKAQVRVETQPSEGDWLVYHIGAEPATLNPMDTTSTFTPGHCPVGPDSLTDIPRRQTNPARWNGANWSDFAAALRAGGVELLESLAACGAFATDAGGTAYGIGISLAITVIFLMMIQLTQAIGAGGLVQPELAAWIPGAVFGVIGSVLLRALWLTSPTGSLIFDEKYYVNAARVILGWAHDADVWVGAPAGLDPNTEHPPLGKLLIAGSMLLFGDTGLGWRLPSVIAAALALVAVFGIVRALGGSRWTGVLAVAIYSLDPLSFIHGRIGVLDGMMVSLSRSFRPSAKGCSRPNGPTTLGPRRSWIDAQTLRSTYVM